MPGCHWVLDATGDDATGDDATGDDATGDDATGDGSLWHVSIEPCQREPSPVASWNLNRAKKNRPRWHPVAPSGTRKKAEISWISAF